MDYLSVRPPPVTSSVDTTTGGVHRCPNASDVPVVSFFPLTRPSMPASASEVDRNGGGYPTVVVAVRRVTVAGADAVWAVLADGWRLGAWVVGAARVDAVDAAWPAVGAGLRYGIGAWPAVLPGAAEVTACRAGHELALHGRTPFGGVDVRVTLAAAASGTELCIEEDVVSGPARLTPARLRAAAIGARNVETLRRLALLAERRAA
jgi:hypothetical protein